MSGHEISIGGRAVTYLGPDDAVPAARDGLVGFDALEDPLLARNPAIRRVLTSLVNPRPTFYGVLHWSDGTDLRVLDDKVRRGVVQDQDFASAVLAEARTIVCRNCAAELRVLAVDTGQALFASSMTERLRAHEFKPSCPVCAEDLGLPIVEFVREDSP